MLRDKIIERQEKTNISDDWQKGYFSALEWVLSILPDCKRCGNFICKRKVEIDNFHAEEFMDITYCSEFKEVV